MREAAFGKVDFIVIGSRTKKSSFHVGNLVFFSVTGTEIVILHTTSSLRFQSEQTEATRTQVFPFLFFWLSLHVHTYVHTVRTTCIP